MPKPGVCVHQPSAVPSGVGWRFGGGWLCFRGALVLVLRCGMWCQVAGWDAVMGWLWGEVMWLVARCHVMWCHEILPLPRQMTPNSAPATKSDAPTSLKAAPAKKSEAPTSPKYCTILRLLRKVTFRIKSTSANITSSTKSDTPTSPNVSPATKSYTPTPHASHEKWRSNNKCCASHKKWYSDITKGCACYQKWHSNCHRNWHSDQQWCEWCEMWVMRVICDVSDVSCEWCEMWAVWMMWDVSDAIDLSCECRVIWVISDVRCERCEMWAMWDVSDVKTLWCEWCGEMWAFPFIVCSRF